MKLIHDRKELTNFVDFLPELRPDEYYYYVLLSRKKYSKEVESNKETLLYRGHCRVEELIYRIEDLEKREFFINGERVPEDSLALYIYLNPRCMKKATIKLGKKCWELVNSTNFNLVSEANSCLQTSKGKSNFLIIDIDSKEVPIEDSLDVINIEAWNCMETRGGYHLLVELAEFNKLEGDWFNILKNHYKLDTSGDLMSPIPGCCQGSFIPKMI